MLHHFNRATTNIQPTFIGSSTLRSTSATPTVTAIANVQAGDLLIAFIVNSNQAATFDGSSDGWTLRATNTGAANVWYLLTKVATGSEASYLFRVSTGTLTLSVLAYRGCEPCQVQVGTTTFANSATQTGASITASNQGTLLFYSYVESASTVTTAPSGMTQRVAQTANSPSASVYELANVSQTTVTGDKTIVYSTSGQGAGVLVQIKTAQRQVITPQYIAQANAATTVASTDLTINKPTGTVENDLMVAFIQASNNNTWSLSGWTSVSSDNGQAILYRVAGASEGSSYTFVQSLSNTSQGVIATFRYCSYDAVGTVLTTASAYPSVTTASKYQLCITFGGRHASTTFTAPAGMTTIFNTTSAPSIIISYINAVGNGTFYGTNTASGSANVRSVSIALKGLVSS
jgi:hypothetical protein